MKVRCVLLGLIALVLVGCKTVSVHDNRYELMLAPSVVVNSDYKYVGNYYVRLPVVTSSKKTFYSVRSDIFVKSFYGTIVDICCIETHEARKGSWGYHYWSDIEGEKVLFKGDKYKFDIATVSPYTSSEYIRSYGRALSKAGYYVRDLHMKVGKMTIKLRNSMGMAMIYAYNERMISVEAENVPEFIMEQLNKNFEVID